MQQLDVSPLEQVRLAVLVDEFYRALEHDAAILAAVCRALSAPKGPAQPHIERFRELMKGQGQ